MNAGLCVILLAVIGADNDPAKEPGRQRNGAAQIRAVVTAPKELHTNKGRICFSPSGRQIAFMSGGEFVARLAPWGPADWVGSIREVGVDQVASPDGAAFVEEDVLWVADNLGRQLVAIDSRAGKVKERLGGGEPEILRQPRWIHVDLEKGRAVLTAEAGDELWFFKTTGKLQPLAWIGATKPVVPDVAAFVDRLDFPQAAVLSGDDLYVCSFSAHELVHYRIRETVFTKLDVKRGGPGGTPSVIKFRFPMSLAASPDGRTLYVGGTGRSFQALRRERDTGRLTLLQELNPSSERTIFPQYCKSISVSRDGGWLAAACSQTSSVGVFKIEADGRLKLHEIVSDPEKLTRQVCEVQWDPKGETLLGISRDIPLFQISWPGK